MFSHSVVSDSVTPWTVACHLLCPWDFPGKNTGVGSHSHPPRPPRGFSHTGIKPTFPVSSALQADSLPTGQSGKTFAEKFYMHSHIERVGNDWTHTNTDTHIYLSLCYTFTLLIKNCLWEPFVCCSWSVLIPVFAHIIQKLEALFSFHKILAI